MIILMGIAGSGKGTQGKMLADKKGYSLIALGDILRVLITGKRRQEMLEGKLLSDDEVIRIIDKELEGLDLKKEFIFDGFPRSAKQANWLIEQARKGRFTITAVVHLDVSEKVVLDRLKQRARQDDTEAAIHKRFEEYRNNTLPIIEHLQKENFKVYDIDGAQSPEAVHEAIVKQLG